MWFKFIFYTNESINGENEEIRLCLRGKISRKILRKASKADPKLAGFSLETQQRGPMVHGIQFFIEKFYDQGRFLKL